LAERVVKQGSKRRQGFESSFQTSKFEVTEANVIVVEARRPSNQEVVELTMDLAHLAELIDPQAEEVSLTYDFEHHRATKLGCLELKGRLDAADLDIKVVTVPVASGVGQESGSVDLKGAHVIDECFESAGSVRIGREAAFCAEVIGHGLQVTGRCIVLQDSSKHGASCFEFVEILFAGKLTSCAGRLECDVPVPIPEGCY
jgi:hypothetical protein